MARSLMSLSGGARFSMACGHDATAPSGAFARGLFSGLARDARRKAHCLSGTFPAGMERLEGAIRFDGA